VTQPVIFGLSGHALTPDEAALFRDADPAGYILFARNCDTPDQVRALTDSLRTLSGRASLPILIDQEGGRVARLRPPHWPAFPPAARFAVLYDVAPISAMRAATLNAQAIGRTLADLGISVNCLPLLDVLDAEGHDIIGDRAYGDDPLRVAALGRATLDGLRNAGVVGVVKHIPGHGRARADSHLELPVVTVDRQALETDLRPFRTLAQAPMAMTAHVVYTAWDAQRCASVSPTVIEAVIRQSIGFDGWLMSDDLGMKALSGGMAARAQAVLAAGCDVALHCSGDFQEMQAIAGVLGAMSAQSAERLARAMAWPAAAPDSPALADLIGERDALLAVA